MPETMSPREKVARIVDPKAFDHPTVHPQHLAWRRAEALITADAILAALASSGDHAELARLAEAAKERARLMRSLEMFSGVSSELEGLAGGVKALLAEIAALRASDERTGELLAESNLRESRATVRATEAERALSEHRVTSDLLVSSLKADKAEAERKLAEAVGLLGRIGFTPDGEDGLSLRECVTLARTFLSKEAERG